MVFYVQIQSFKAMRTEFITFRSMEKVSFSHRHADAWLKRNPHKFLNRGNINIEASNGEESLYNLADVGNPTFKKFNTMRCTEIQFL